MLVQTLLDRIEAEVAAGMKAGGEGHVGLRHEALCLEPTPVTWFMDADGDTWVVVHRRYDPDGDVPDELLRNLGFTITPKCPLVGERLGWCCCHAARRDQEPTADEAVRLAAEYVRALAEIERHWTQVLHGASGLLRTAQAVTGAAGRLHVGAGDHDGKPLWYWTLQPRR